MKVTFKGKPLIPSKYLEAADLQGKRVTVTIESIKQEKMPSEGDEDEFRPIFRLVGKSKGWILNTTNLESIAEVYGWEAENWIGKSVVIYPTKVKAFGAWCPCIRVDVGETDKRAKAAGHKKTDDGGEPDHDEVTGEVREPGSDDDAEAVAQ